jgi:hypothetical protein
MLYIQAFKLTVMKRLLSIFIVLAFIACEPRQGKNVDQAPPTSENNQDVHEAVITEIIQAPSYTYARATENGSEFWMAVGASEIEVGKTYFYSQPLEMTNFKSKELDRTFESILFINKLVSDPSELTAKKASPHPDGAKAKDAIGRQPDLVIEPQDGVITIGELYANKSAYANKTVKVKGLVTKFNAGIMERNWVHIQDGTGSDTGYDLTITTEAMVSTGQIVVFEGVFSLDKDFGYGYKYDLIIEKAILDADNSDKKPNT